MIITKRHIKMMSPEGFDRLFEQEINRDRTHEQVFYDLNDEYKKAFHVPRYSSYNSYRNARARRIKSKQIS